MQTSDPSAASDDQGDSSDSEGTPELVPDQPKTTEEIWDEIVAQLSDLSTKETDDKTAPPQESEKEPQGLSFPTAPWVTGPRIENLSDSDPDEHDFADRSSSPRDWADDDFLLHEIDRFIEPDPELELSKDPVRNVAWFLTTLAGMALLVSAIFMRPVHGPSMLILLVLFLGGIALLIWRMPSTRNDSDSGAVV